MFTLSQSNKFYLFLFRERELFPELSLEELPELLEDDALDELPELREDEALDRLPDDEDDRLLVPYERDDEEDEEPYVLLRFELDRLLLALSSESLYLEC